ncbi:MAG: bifunctional (p)ppGpp synthetase/guanosine-3',5'-bis(diphosphate) 3'-pyrophosphohydrolase [Proteobacteria bacterium]|nr:bifunctional (p)ppGpp synthetase/guanosine-3',5'-bis(diphosphate) 3'-pyrophosphohydrolase [Pseudomonadota bacterium]
MIRQYELVERVKAYDPKADEDALNRGYVFAMKAHGSQRRASGDPYFSHPIEVAGILTGIRLDCATIITALLHDTVEDTGVTLDEIRDLFGGEVAQLVDGVTKLTRLELQSDQTKQAENFRKLLLAMSEDIRVLLVKLADRLHNMRTLQFVDDAEKRKRVARETMEIFAPLAERIGMQGMKDELEGLAFAEINPDARDSVIARLEFLRDEGGNQVPRIAAELERTLAEADVVAAVSGREKQPYSIWRKMQRKNIAFEQLSDIVAFRVVVESVAKCYQTLGVVHGAYSVVPGRFKDFISTPKPNGYQSIHTTVIGPESQRIEIQIRTREMHEFAEYGVAAHWHFKQLSGALARPEGRQYRWIRELLEILEHASDPEEFLEHTKLEMYQDQVFCFTPKGDLIALPRGATPVDFAYAVHSEVGDTCVGAKINGRMKPLRTLLHNGDQVEIVCSKAQTPSPTWERFVVTGKARSRIRRFVRLQQRAQYVDLGRAIVQKGFRVVGQKFSKRALQRVLKTLRFKTVDDLYATVGQGVITGRKVIEQVFPDLKLKEGKVVSLTRRRAKRAEAGEHAVSIRGLIPGMAMHFAGCCHPLPGDRIVGIVTTGKGVTIHTIDCETLESFTESPERWLDVAWDQDPESTGIHLGRINIVVMNEPGSLGSLSTVIAKNLGNISNLKITNRSTDFFEMLVDIEVQDVKHLTNIIAALRVTPTINSVERARG